MWFYRRMLRIPYTDHITNEEVLRRVGQDRELLESIRVRQLKFLGHAIRKGSLEDLSLSGKVEGKRARGGQRKTYLDNFNIETRRHLWDKARQREHGIK